MADEFNLSTPKKYWGPYTFNECTYRSGEPPARQSLFGCRTCEKAINPETGTPYQAGFCIGCAVKCHNGHDIHEMWTKRNFNCDCGTDRFAKPFCTLTTRKVGLINVTNLYNHNFDDLYCSCNKIPFPPEYELLPGFNKQYQCYLCEDWYHLPHFGTIRSLKKRYSYCCYQCIDKYPFLPHYLYPLTCSDSEAFLKIFLSLHKSLQPTWTHSGLQQQQCILKILRQNFCQNNFGVDSNRFQATYETILGWQRLLCRCRDCLDMYKDMGIEFILRSSDSKTVFIEETIKFQAIQNDLPSE